MLLALKVRSRGYKRTRKTCPKSMMERMNGCRELGCCSVVCSGFDELIRFESPMVCCDEFRSLVRYPIMGRPAFPFIGQGKARVTAGEKGESGGEEVL